MLARTIICGVLVLGTTPIAVADVIVYASEPTEQDLRVLWKERFDELQVGPDGTLWMQSSVKLYRKPRSEIHPHLVTLSGIGDVHRYHVDPDGVIWLVAEPLAPPHPKDGPKKMPRIVPDERADDLFRVTPNDPDPKPIDWKIGRVRAISEGWNGTLWFHTDRGLFRKARGSPVPDKKNWGTGNVTRLHDDPDGTLWLTCAVLDPEDVERRSSLRLFRQARDMEKPEPVSWEFGESVYLYSDRSHTLWIEPTFGKTYRKDRGQEPRQVDWKPIGKIECVHEDKNGTRWFGTMWGLYRFRTIDPEPVPLGLLTSTVHSLCEDAEGNLWISASRGMFRLSGLYTEWNANIELTKVSVSVIHSDTPLIFSWKIRDYAGRSTPTLAQCRIRVRTEDGTEIRCWNTEKGNDSFAFNPETHGALSPGTYSVEIEVEDLHGKTSTSARQAITVRTETSWWDRQSPELRTTVWGSGLFVAYVALCFAVFWVRPLWILKINRLLEPISLKIPKLDLPVSARWLTLVAFFNYRPWVLDSWVAIRLKTARDNLQRRDIVAVTASHVPLPVTLDGKDVEFTPAQFASVFAQDRVPVLIHGQGGAGKTSLACQLCRWALAADPRERLARHVMLPIILEGELDLPVAGGRHAFMESIRGQLQNLVSELEPIPDQLLEHLLRRRRVMVVIDGFSEKGSATRDQIRPDDPQFPVNALVLTSRLAERLHDVPKYPVTPIPLKGAGLAFFLERYLVGCRKRDLFTEPAFHEACTRLSRIIGDREITVLFCRMFADVLIDSVRPPADPYPALPGELDATADEVEPSPPGPVLVASPRQCAAGVLTIPELVLAYLNFLNRHATQFDPDNRTVHRDCKLIAYEYLRRHFRPSPVKREAIITTLVRADQAEREAPRQAEDRSVGADTGLSGEDEEKVKARLAYLEIKLRLIRSVGPGEDKLEFVLDPVAEYLAGFHAVESFKGDSRKWKEFFTKADDAADAGIPKVTTSFLRAVRDCCRVPDITSRPIPDQVLGELDSRIG